MKLKLFKSILIVCVLINFIEHALSVVFAQLSDLSHCIDANRTVYLRTESSLVADPPALTFVDLTLSECATKCTNNVEGINCRSFEYNSNKQSCALKEAISQPFGRSAIDPLINQPEIAFFQRICIPSWHSKLSIYYLLGEEICVAPYTFERFPQKVLSGHSMEVITTESLSECLMTCLESRKRTKLECRSTMFYYETGQCILNREWRRSTAPKLFTNDTKYQLVDYFENNCFDG